MTDIAATSVEGINAFLADELPGFMDPLQVAEGYPDDGAAAESLWVMDSVMDQIDAASPRLYTEETGHTNMWLMVGLEGGTAAECRHLVTGHLRTLKAFVKANPSLGGFVCPTALMVPVGWTPGILKDAEDNWIGRDLVVPIELRWKQDGLPY